MVPPGGQGLGPRGALQEGLPRGQHVQAGLGALGVCRPPEQLQRRDSMRNAVGQVRSSSENHDAPIPVRCLVALAAIK